MGLNKIVRQFAGFLGVAALVLYLVSPPLTKAQASLTTGAVTGYVTDPSGAVVPNASVTATNADTGVSRSATTAANGSYVIPLLDPGQYKVQVKAAGFKTQEQGPVTVVVSQSLDLDFHLALGSTTQVVEVTGAAPLLQTTNPNTTSTLGTQQIENIPNPGMDLSYEANFAAGAIMNTTGGYGNVEYNGLPAGSNNFTIDGLDANDPFLNLNNSGATNLQLGLGATQEVSVNTTSYSVDQGRLGASQINFLTKAGTNNYHGNLWETWNGSKLNATDFFINSHQFESPAPRKPRSNVNQFGGSIGGPFIHNKLFFFGDFEEIRIIVPIVSSTLTPSTNYRNYELSQLATGGCDYVFDPGDCAAGVTPATEGTAAFPGTFANFPATVPQPAQIPFYQNMWNLYGSKTGTPQAIFGCPIAADGSLLPVPSLATPTASTPNGVGCGIASTFPQVNLTDDQFILVKVDQNVNDRNSVWYKFAREHGLQATYTDPINPLFYAISDQPQYNGEVGWTHTFGPTMVNEFTPGVVWYSAIFEEPNLAKSLQAFPITCGGAFGIGPCGAFTALGGADWFWPQGRNVTQWQLIDNLTWSHGTHTLKFGENLRRVLVSDHDFGIFNTPVVLPLDLPELTYGITGFNIQNFPRSLNEPFGLVNFDVFAQDTYRVNPKLTLTYGLRATWNSDPVDQQKLVARFAGNWYQIPHDVNRPLNQDIQTGLSKVFPSTPTIVWQPRLALAYEINSKTIFRGGFGVFSDIFPASLADSMATNPPYDNQFTEGVFGLDNGFAVAPGVPGSGVDAAVTDNQTFLAGFSSGVLSCSSPLAGPGCLPQVGITAVEHYMKYPYFLQWSGGIQRQFSTNFLLNVQYVGTHADHIPYTIGPNGHQTVCAGCYSPWPTSAPDQRFFGATQYLSGANSNYNALQASVNKRFSHGLDFQFNYTWSHCLDTISNGGIFTYGNPGNLASAIPGNLKRNYGPCDYDYRHSFNGYYTYELPFHSASRLLSQVLGGWGVSGSAIYHGGQPFSIGTPLQGGALVNTSGPVYPNLVPGQPLYQKSPVAGTTLPGNMQWLNPSAFAGVVDANGFLWASPGGEVTKNNLCVPAGTTNFSPDNLYGPVVDPLTGARSGTGVEPLNPTPSCSQFGNLGRNLLRGPGFGWGDLFLTKRFKLTERATLVISGQAYNFLNHPNFRTAGATAGVPGIAPTLVGFGNISSTASPPTGLLGSFLGGDTSPRMIALKGQIQF